MTVPSVAPLQFLILLVASWLGRRQGHAVEFLRVENRVLRGRLGPRRLRFTDAERRLLAEAGRPLGPKSARRGGVARDAGDHSGGTARALPRNTTAVVRGALRARKRFAVRA